MSLSDAVAKHKKYLFPAVSMYYKEPIELVRGEGPWVWDHENRETVHPDHARRPVPSPGAPHPA